MALSDAYTLCELDISPGVEVFTPPLPKGKRLKLIFTGACAVKQSSSPWIGLDACYSADTYDHNYKHRHYKLLLDSKVPAKGPFEEDRCKHRYAFSYEATGGRLAVLLEPPVIAIDTKATTGAIHLCVVPLSLTEVLRLGLDGDARKREDEERRRQEEVAKKAVEWAMWAHLERNFLDAEYQHKFAAKHRDKILTKFTQEWLTEYQQLLSNEELYTRIQTEYQHVLEVLESRFEVIRIAQRLSVEPTPEPPPPVEPKPKKTLDEVLAGIERHRRWELNKKRVKADDFKADIMQQLEILQEFISDLENYPLDEDERERLIQEFKERLLGGEEESNNGFRQL